MTGVLTKEEIISALEPYLASHGLFLVDLHVDRENNIKIEIDSMSGVKLQDCVALTRFFEKNYDRNIYDYSLEVSSPGIDTPFKTEQQWKKNINKEVEVVTVEGRKIIGKLLSFNAKTFTITPIEIKKRGKQQVYEEKQEKQTIERASIKSIKKHLNI